MINDPYGSIYEICKLSNEPLTDKEMDRLALAIMPYLLELESDDSIQAKRANLICRLLRTAESLKGGCGLRKE